MSTIEVLPITRNQCEQANARGAYLIKNNVCNCAAAVIPSGLTNDEIEKLIAEIELLNSNLEWILIAEKPAHPNLVRLIQAKCGGVIAGNSTSLSEFASNSSFSDCQFEELSEHQVILLGHIELLVLPSGNKNKSCFFIENNLICSECQSELPTHDCQLQSYKTMNSSIYSI